VAIAAGVFIRFTFVLFVAPVLVHELLKWSSFQVGMRVVFPAGVMFLLLSGLIIALDTRLYSLIHGHEVFVKVIKLVPYVLALAADGTPPFSRDDRLIGLLPQWGPSYTTWTQRTSPTMGCTHALHMRSSIRLCCLGHYI